MTYEQIDDPATIEGSGQTGVVVGVDGSRGSRVALEWALETDERLGQVHPVTAWSLPWWSAGGAGASRSSMNAARVGVEKLVGEVMCDFDSSRLAEPVIDYGGAPMVLGEAVRGRALLVVGTRGYGTVLDTILGSVAVACSLRAVRPLAVVPDLSKRSGPCVVGVDGSANARAALIFAMRHAPRSSDIIAVNAFGRPNHGVDLPASDRRDLGARSVELLENVASAAAAAVPGAPRPAMRSVFGDARTVLEGESGAAAMVVVGSRGDGGLRQVVLGSVATALVHQPACPTVIVPVG